MPYRIDIRDSPPDAFDLLVQLGALDIESVNSGLAAILPDSVTPESLTAALGGVRITASPAVARDNGSVWLLSPRAIRIGGVLVGSPEETASSTTLRLIDSLAFGTGHHPTTALCIEALEEIVTCERVESVLDVGTGSGILALTALKLGVPQAVGLDIDAEALKVAGENARLNHLTDRLKLVLGGPEVVEGRWPLVVANVLAAPLMDMAPVLVQRVASREPWPTHSFRNPVVTRFRCVTNVSAPRRLVHRFRDTRRMDCATGAGVLVSGFLLRRSATVYRRLAFAFRLRFSSVEIVPVENDVEAQKAGALRLPAPERPQRKHDDMTLPKRNIPIAQLPTPARNSFHQYLRLPSGLYRELWQLIISAQLYA